MANALLFKPHKLAATERNAIQPCISMLLPSDV